MPTPFLSSEEYDARAHQLYNEGLYDEALKVLQEGLTLYPNSVELHIGVGYARMAREEVAWARRSFEEALVLEPEHEDALAGLGETLLRVGQLDAATRCFTRILELGYTDDLDLMLQVGRALFREGSAREQRELFERAIQFFEEAVRQAPDSPEAIACIGYTQHRMGNDAQAVALLHDALRLEPEHTEARIYLANILYDQTDYEGALYHFEQTDPADHWDELGIWRVVELMKSVYHLDNDDAELKVWHKRISDLNDELDDVDELFMDLEGGDGAKDDQAVDRNQLEMFGALLVKLVEGDAEPTDRAAQHQVVSSDGSSFAGSWDEIVLGMRDADSSDIAAPLHEYMQRRASRVFTQMGIQLPCTDAESFVRASARAGLLRIVR